MKKNLLITMIIGLLLGSNAQAFFWATPTGNDDGAFLTSLIIPQELQGQPFGSPKVAHSAQDIEREWFKRQHAENINFSNAQYLGKAQNVEVYYILQSDKKTTAHWSGCIDNGCLVMSCELSNLSDLLSHLRAANKHSVNYKLVLEVNKNDAQEFSQENVQQAISAYSSMGWGKKLLLGAGIVALGIGLGMYLDSK